MDWLEDAEERQACLLQQVSEPQVAYAQKAGWIWRFAKGHRKWVKRWGVFCSKTKSFTFLKTPVQRGQMEKPTLKARSPAVASTSTLKHRLILGSSKYYGFGVQLASGRTMTLCLPTAEQRTEWVQFVNDSLASEVTLHERYDVHWQCVIGRGAYADVVIGTDRLSGEPVAVKMVTKTACQKHFDMMDKEAQIMSLYGSHPHLLKLRSAFYSDDHIFLVSELLEGGNLMHGMVESLEISKGGFTEDRARNIFKQLLYAVDWLHSGVGVSHCDIKPENIIFQSRDSDAHIKLTDFNSAVFFDERTEEPGGTPEYMAPELASLESDSQRECWDSALDMWALGILLFWMLCRYTPFHADSVPGVLHNVRHARLEWPQDVLLSDEVKALISSLLQKEPYRRPSAKEVLQDNWMKGGTTLKPLLNIMADARALLPALGVSVEEAAEPVSLSCHEIDNATLAAMHASTPSHLCIRVPRHSSGISYGFAASSAQVADRDDSGLAIELSGLEVSDSMLSLDCPTPSDAATPGGRDPMDSCMSVHRDLAFRSVEAESSGHPSPSEKEAKDPQGRKEVEAI